MDTSQKITLSKGSQTQNSMYCVLPFITINPNVCNRKQIDDCMGPEVGIRRFN